MRAMARSACSRHVWTMRGSSTPSTTHASIERAMSPCSSSRALTPQPLMLGETGTSGGSSETAIHPRQPTSAGEVSGASRRAERNRRGRSGAPCRPRQRQRLALLALFERARGRAAELQVVCAGVAAHLQHRIRWVRAATASCSAPVKQSRQTTPTHMTVRPTRIGRRAGQRASSSRRGAEGVAQAWQRRGPPPWPRPHAMSREEIDEGQVIHRAWPASRSSMACLLRRALQPSPAMLVPFAEEGHCGLPGLSSERPARSACSAQLAAAGEGATAARWKDAMRARRMNTCMGRVARPTARPSRGEGSRKPATPAPLPIHLRR